MPRVVFDTNIFISAIHFQSNNPRKLLELATQGKISLIISKKILAEIRGVLRVKFNYDKEMLDMLEELIMETVQMVEPTKRITAVKFDPDDNMVLECAVEGKADYIVSGDKDLLDIKEYKRIKILTVREVLDKIL